MGSKVVREVKVWGKSVCAICVWGKILETIYSCSLPYVHFC
jgi:hypothetical protein